MALIDEDYLRGTFNIHKEVLDARITPYIAAASRRLSGWVGDTNYANSDLADELKLAEGLIAMHLLQLNINTAIRPNGLVRRETVENQVVVEYLSVKDTELSANAFLEQAEEIVRRFNQASDLPAVASVAAVSSSCEGATRPC